MKDETAAVLSDSSLIAAREMHFERMKRIYAGETPEHPYILWGFFGFGTSNFYQEPEKWVCEALNEVAGKAYMLRDEDAFRPLVVECPMYGVHFIDRMFGADVFELEPGNWQVHTLDTPIGELEPPDLGTDDTWDLARRVAQAFLETGVSVPLFGLPTLSSALNTAVNLYGQDILTEMYVNPEAARHDLTVINDVIVALHRWYLEHIPVEQLQPVVAGARTQPPGYGQLCGCTTQLVSEEVYREFIAPLDDAILSLYPHGGMIHLCGAHEQHIEVWRNMPSLVSLQIQDRAAYDINSYYDGLRDNQLLYPFPCEEVPYEQIVRKTLGRRVVITVDPQSIR